MLRSLAARRVEGALLAILCTVGWAGHRANLSLETRVRTQRATGDVGPLPDGAALRVLSLGFDRLVADLFWLRTVYYVGDETSHQAGYPAVERLANLVTDIDPHFQTVYVVMSGALSGLRGDPDAAIRLLEKGVRYLEYWKLHFLLGFNYFIERMDYASAAEQMRIASTLGGPPYLPLLSARLYAQAGDPETALAFIGARLQEAESPETRQALQKRYWDLWLTRDIRQIDAAIQAYRERHGEEPEDVAALVEAGMLEREPVDPRGGAYRIEAGRASTDLEYEELVVHRAHPPTAEQTHADYERLRREQEGGPR